MENENLHSPNYPLNYSNGLSCEWRIAAYENYWITIEFHELNVCIQLIKFSNELNCISYI